MKNTQMLLRRAPLAALAAGLVMGCLSQQTGPTGARPAAVVSAPTSVTEANHDDDKPGLLRLFAVNAFVVPVLDDSEPPRFTDIYRTILCADRSSLRVDGKPMVAGELVPPGAFALEWNLDGYCPFGVDGPLVHGRVEVLVFRDEQQGLSAMLRPVTVGASEPQLMEPDSSEARVAAQLITKALP